MRKEEFLTQLRKGLGGLPQEDMEERLAFYSEMIDDRMDEGLSEEEAVATVGTVSEIVEDISPTKPAGDAAAASRRLKTWEILLLVLGSPIWLSLGIAAAAVILSVFISVIASVWAVFGAVAACGVGFVAGGAVMACTGHNAPGLALVAAGLVAAGLSIFLFCGCKAATKGVCVLTRKMAAALKNFFRRKEAS